MKPQAVFVETNWVVDIVAPAHLQSPQASELLAAILVRAEDLQQQGFSWVGFCELDSDLQPWDKNGVKKPILSDLYHASHVWVYRDFLVEDVDELPEVWFSEN